MDEVDLWATREEDTFETFTDALGNERRERVPSLPLPDLVDRGAAASNGHKLDMFTTGPARPSKGGEVEATPMDPDAQQRKDAVGAYAADWKRRSNVQVDLNRRGLQARAASDVERRDDLYDGNNVKERDAFVKRLQPTRRSTSLFTTFRERHDPHAVQTALAPEVEEARRAGLWKRRDAGGGEGVAPSLSKPARERESDAVHMGGVHGSADAAALADAGRAATVAHPRARSLAVLGADASVASAAPRASAHVAKASLGADVTLGTADSVRAARTVAGTAPEDHRAALAPDAVLGVQDALSVDAGDRVTHAPSTYYLHASRQLGSRDSQRADAARASASARPDVSLPGTAPEALEHVHRADGARGRVVAYEEERRRVLDAHRARDLASDAATVERLVHDGLERKAALASARARANAADAHDVSDAVRASMRDVAPASRAARARPLAPDAVVPDVRGGHAESDARVAAHTVPERVGSRTVLALRAALQSLTASLPAAAPVGAAVARSSAREGELASHAPLATGAAAPRRPVPPVLAREDSLAVAAPRRGALRGAAASLSSDVVLARGVRA